MSALMSGMSQITDKQSTTSMYIGSGYNRTANTEYSGWSHPSVFPGAQAAYPAAAITRPKLCRRDTAGFTYSDRDRFY